MILSALKYVFLFGLFIFPSCASSRPTIIDIDATNNNYSEIGKFIGEETQKHFPTITKIYDDYLSFILSQAQFKELISQVESLRNHVNPDYKEEVDAISAVWQLNTIDNLGDGKLSVNEFWLLQFFPDLIDIDKGVAIATLNKTNKNPLVARNVDWKSTPDLRALQSINIYHYPETTLVSIGFAGLIGVINGFNSEGLFVSLLDASKQQVVTTLNPVNSAVFDLRYTLQHNDKIAKANKMLSSKFYARSHEIIFADSENIAILEQFSNKNGVLRKIDSEIVNEMTNNDGSNLVAVNCLVLKNYFHNCQSSTDYYQWEKLTKLLKPFAEKFLSVKNAIALMQNKDNGNYAIFNNNTLQSLIFTPKDKILYLYTENVEQPFASPPLVERYQLINNSPSNLSSILVNIEFLLGFGILVFAWWYIFNRHKFRKL